MSAIEKVDESENRANRNRQVILFAANLSARVAEKVEVKAAFRFRTGTNQDRSTVSCAYDRVLPIDNGLPICLEPSTESTIPYTPGSNTKPPSWTVSLAVLQ
jgi:hypothetical protein